MTQDMRMVIWAKTKERVNVTKKQISREVSAYLAQIGQRGGKKGGQSTSEAKKQAARANGMKGGKSPKTYNSDGLKRKGTVLKD